jgi:hypothetical protein
MSRSREPQRSSVRVTFSEQEPWAPPGADAESSGSVMIRTVEVLSEV